MREPHPYEGVLNIDKPAGLTSHDIVARLRRVAGMKRIGHAGTLDPLATGVLLLCLGRATRLVEYLVGQPKTYETRIRLGQTTDTYDADGTVLEERPVAIVREEIEAALPPFRGEIQQIPPMYSAIKRQGQPLYKLARQGIEVERAARNITIYDLSIIKWETPFLELRIVCSAGTYIRSLAHDLGANLGCGGHITQLRRTQIGTFTTENAVALDEVDAERLSSALHPADRAVAHLPRLALSTQDANMIEMGKLIPRAAEASVAPFVRGYDPDGIFIGILKPAGQDWKAHKIFVRD